MSVELSEILSDEEMAASGLTAEDLTSMDDEPVPDDPHASDDDGEDGDDDKSQAEADDGDDGGEADDGQDAGADEGEDDPAQAEADKATPVTADERGPRSSYEAKLPDDFDARMEDLTKRTDALEAKYRDGDISFDEFRAEERKLQTEARDLDRIKTKAEISAESEQQAALREWNWSVDRFKRMQAQAGVNYAEDPKLEKSLDQFVRVLAQDPDNASRDAEWFLSEAHKRVCIMHGIEQGPAKKGVSDANAPKATSDEPPRKPKRDKIPVTLAELEGGDGQVDDIAGEFADLERLEGEAYERAFEKMSPAQRERYLAQ